MAAYINQLFCALCSSSLLWLPFNVIARFILSISSKFTFLFSQQFVQWVGFFPELLDHLHLPMCCITFNWPFNISIWSSKACCFASRPFSSCIILSDRVSFCFWRIMTFKLVRLLKQLNLIQSDKFKFFTSDHIEIIETKENLPRELYKWRKMSCKTSFGARNWMLKGQLNVMKNMGDKGDGGVLEKPTHWRNCCEKRRVNLIVWIGWIKL